MASNPVGKLTEEEYLALDRAAEFKSEFIDGEMFAMSGVSFAHSVIQGNLLAELHVLLRGKGCKPHSSDLRVRVSPAMYVYPDISVVCGKPALADERRDVLLNPIVICEVISPSTASYDRGVKFRHYRAIASLKDYVLLEQDSMIIEHYTRQQDESWALRDYRAPEAELKIGSIGVSIPLSRIYDGVEFGA